MGSEMCIRDRYWAYRGGQSVWNFITEKWGEESIAEIIKQIKAKGNVNLGVKSAISITIDELSEQWHKYLKKQYWPDINNKTNIAEISFQLTDHEKLNNHYNIAPTISPNGKEIALFSDRKGIINLYLMNATDGKFIKRIIRGQRTLEFEEMHIERIMNHAKIFTNGLEDIDIDRVSIGWRPLPKDGVPVIGRINSIQGVYVAMMHSGVSLAAVVSKLVTEEILEDKNNSLLDHFRPSRFA